jgi:DNA-binding transcriptional LysR family regulator
MHSGALEHFLAVYRHGSISKASKELRISQPALTKTIRRLEDELHVQLFKRSPAGVEKTRFADALARRAKIVCNELSRATSEIASLSSELAGHAWIGVGPAIASSLIPDALRAFLRDRPKMSVTVVEGLYEALVPKVMDGSIDFAVTTPSSSRLASGLEAELLFKDQFSIVAGKGHPLLKKRGATLADLLQFPWVLPPAESIIRQRLAEAFKGKRLPPPEPQVETDSIVCIKALLLSGAFVGLAPWYLVSREVTGGKISILKIANSEYRRDVVALLRVGSVLPPASQALLAFLRAFVGKHGVPR